MRTWPAAIIGVLSLAGVLTLSLASAGIQEGNELYAQYCEACHGGSGEGVGGMGELTTRGQLMVSDEQLFEVIRQGRSSMPGFDGLLTGEEVRDIILFLRTLQ